ncbi:hypothetical protein WICPIJ_008225 [Wickerhamomyces pijperi]|uniref:Acyl-CoA dehydrogenase n=1 Tax=Wickerhamomyces pijperi TaxID=599730 RepID=A0A9P8PZT9_WICPI|nr:hypothetical protein WICPIJ_008225 [Wickerhamomyces pijperi]
MTATHSSIEQYIPPLVRSQISARARETLSTLQKFIEEDCLPADNLFHSHFANINGKQRFQSIAPVIEPLKTKAKSLKLWNLFLSNQYEEGAGYSNLEYGLMCQLIGRSYVAAEVTNTAAPDTGNMEILAKYGSVTQKRKWLQPLLNGEIRSAFLMTEKGISSSNALNISLSCKKINDGRSLVLNGTKWFASGAGDPRCSVWLTMALTNPSAINPYHRHSIILIDSKRALATGRARIVRPLEVFGFDDAPHGHCEIVFDDLVVPLETLGSEGQGFAIIQSRLGPGRIHHCMRIIGIGEEALNQALHRAANRHIFGELFVKRESFITGFAEQRIKLERVKLLVLQAALKIDQDGVKAAKKEIALAKIDAPRTVLDIVDWAIQVFGAEGVSQDTPLTRFWIYCRMCRIADGPDEAHLNQVGKDICKDGVKRVDSLYKSIEKDTRRLQKREQKL